LKLVARHRRQDKLAKGTGGTLRPNSPCACKPDRVITALIGPIAVEVRKEHRAINGADTMIAPAVTLIEVSKLYAPDFLIEIEAVAAMSTAPPASR
jgi:hypothetical protein